MLTKEDILRLPRRKVRYQLYRIRNYVEGGTSHQADELKEFYEGQEGFAGWRGFARTWDIGEEGEHCKIVERIITEEQEWNYLLNSLAEEFPWRRK